MEILWANKSAGDQVNKTSEQMIGLKCHDCFMDSKTKCNDCPSSKAFKTRKSERALVNGPDGKIWDEIGEPVFDDEGNFMGVVDIAQDITERKRAEESLRESEERLTLALEGANEGLWDWNIETDEVYFSPYWTEMLGYSSDEIKPHISSWKELIHPEDKLRVLKTLDSHLKGNTPYCEIESRLKTKSGEWKWLLTHGRVLQREKNGRPLRAVGTQVDITEIKKTEEKLKESQQRSRNLSAHLQSIREEERTRIAREIHDELSQVLTLLKMDLVWMKERITDDQEEMANKIDSMLKLANDTISTVQKIAGQLRPAMLDDLGLVAAIEWGAKEFEKRTRIKCRLDLIAEDVIIDRELSTAIFRIFQEALTNITRHAKATRVNVKLREKSSNLILEVGDNGIGIAGEKIRDSKSFGLMGIQERALFLGGKVRISGIPNKGTIITVEIPMEKAPILR
jgi:two-component system, NarL family, sensor histidine kinase UhpB